MKRTVIPLIPSMYTGHLPGGGCGCEGGGAGEGCEGGGDDGG